MNLNGLLDAFATLPAYAAVRQALPDSPALRALGLPGSARPPLTARLFQDLHRPLLLITGRVDRVPIWVQALEGWLPAGAPILRFPEPTPLPYDRGPWSQRAILRRLRVLTRLMAGQHPLLPADSQPPIIVTSLRALSQKTMPRSRFVAHTRLYRVGQIVDLEKMVQQWRDGGYVPASVVEAPGQYSRRGGILDLFPVGAPYPLRIELFGDEIDTMRYFDPATQRTVKVENEDPQHVLVSPAREALPAQAAALGAYLEAEAPPKGDELPAWQDDIPLLLAGEAFPNLEYYLPLLYGRPASLFDYLPENAQVVVDDWVELHQAAHDLARTASQMAEEQHSLPLDYPGPLTQWEDLAAEITGRAVLVLGDHAVGDEPLSRSPLADRVLPGPRYGGQMRPFLAQLRHARRDRERTVVVSRQAERLSDLWRQALREDGSLLAENATRYRPVAQLPALPEPGSVTFVQGSLAEGFLLENEQDNAILLNLLTDAEIFGWKRPAPRRRRTPQPSAPETPFADITAGDYVVHLDHGIGRFLGLVVRQIGGTEREYLQIQYSGSDVLYVPVHHADRLSKWVGAESGTPAVQRLGEKSWRTAKARALRAVNELADELVALYATRETVAGHAFAPDGEWQAELEASFPYQETEDQLQALADVKRDMELDRPMDRLICGDVGYGKTEVALRAAFKAVEDGKQVAVLVPTTVLAQQHFNTFRERLRAFPMAVDLLSRFRTPTRQAQTIKKMRAGEIDIVIGTHRLLSDDVAFKDLGLLIIDEEQRFGVGHKERFKQLRTEVDVLTMTATPIPRTLHMGLAGIRDISIINTAPAERLPVQTYVGEIDESLLKRAILRELDRGGQVYVVHNRVQTIQIIRRQIQRLFPEAKVAIGHGQMAERELEKVMGRFIEGEIDVLVATTIIENGLDIPNANTLIVDHAEHFGLAQLYQLRGRVGRGAQRAYAYFFHAPWRSVTEDAQTRLEALAEHTDLGSGYEIAMRDLEIRGAGELLGPQQSGHIGVVGFDLYTKMLSRAVKARKAAQRGEVVSMEALEDTMIDLPLATYIPVDYVPDSGLRLRLYRRMAGLESLADVDVMAEELADRFGPIPDPVDNLLYQLRVKSLAMRALVTAITTEKQQIRIRLPQLEHINRTAVQRAAGPGLRFSRSAIWMGRDLGTNEWRIALVQLLERLGAFFQEASPRPAATTQPSAA